MDAELDCLGARGKKIDHCTQREQGYNSPLGRAADSEACGRSSIPRFLHITPIRPLYSSIGMLQVEKARLEAETARDVSVLRNTELQYYVDNIGQLQTMATLLAGFAFAAFVSQDTTALQLSVLRFEETTMPASLDVEPFNASSPSAGGYSVKPSATQPFDSLAWLTFGFHLLETASIVLCLGDMLYVCLETLLARILGSRLALRGPDGSIIRATQNLARALASSTRRFVRGLQWFLLSIMMHALRGMHPVIAGVVTIIVLKQWRGQFKLVSRLARWFELRKAVSTAFTHDPNSDGVGEEASGDAVPESTVARYTKLGHSVLNPLAALEDLFAQVRSSLRRDQSRNPKETRPPVRLTAITALSLCRVHSLGQVDDTTDGDKGLADAGHNRPRVAVRNLIYWEERRQLASASSRESELNSRPRCPIRPRIERGRTGWLPFLRPSPTLPRSSTTSQPSAPALSPREIVDAEADVEALPTGSAGGASGPMAPDLSRGEAGSSSSQRHVTVTVDRLPQQTSPSRSGLRFGSIRRETAQVGILDKLARHWHELLAGADMPPTTEGSSRGPASA